jgi:hypothetical protein
MQHVFDLLAEIRKRPGMYVGGGPDDRIEQMSSLEMLLRGYGWAVEINKAPEPVPDFFSGFSSWLKTRFHWSLSCGPMAAIQDHCKTPEEAWERFWTLVDEYRKELGVEASPER